MYLSNCLVSSPTKHETYCTENESVYEKVYDQYGCLDRKAVDREVQKFFSTIERDAAVLAHRLDGIRRSILKICTEKVSISSNSGVGVRRS